MNADELYKSIDVIRDAVWQYERSVEILDTEFHIRPTIDNRIEILVTVPLRPKIIEAAQRKISEDGKLRGHDIQITFTATLESPGPHFQNAASVEDICVEYHPQTDMLILQFEEGYDHVVYDHEPIILYVTGEGRITGISLRGARKYIKHVRQEARGSG